MMLDLLTGPDDPAAWIPWAMGMTMVVTGSAILLVVGVFGPHPQGYSHIPFIGFVVFGLVMATLATAL